MPKTKDQKKEILKRLSEKLKEAKAVVFAKFDKLGVNESEVLRRELRKENGEYLVAKKTLVNLAFKDQKLENFDAKNFEGQLAVIFGFGEEVSPAKVVDKFRTEHEGKVEFVGGILENNFISASQVDELAKLPAREELYARLVGSINAPVSGFVNALAGNLRNLVYVLKAIEEKK